MEQRTERLYPSALLEKDDLEKRLEEKLKNVNSFNSHINSVKDRITYFKDRNNKSKKRYKKYKTLTTKLKSFDTFVFIATTSSSITLTLTGIGLMVILISNGIASRLPIGIKVIYDIIIKNYNKYKKQFEKDQQTIKSFDNLYKKSLQDKIINKIEYERVFHNFNNYCDDIKS